MIRSFLNNVKGAIERRQSEAEGVSTEEDVITKLSKSKAVRHLQIPREKCFVTCKGTPPIH